MTSPNGETRVVVTLADIERLLPEAAIEEVGDRRELVIYTGLAAEVYDPETDTWAEAADGRLVPYPQELHR